jgi:hypothetical protein
VWHTLVRDEPPPPDTIRRASETSILKSPAATTGWLEQPRSTATGNEDKVRIFVIDDVHKDVFLREWAGLSQAEYLPLKGQSESILDSVAERLVEDCRSAFQRSIFLLSKPNMVAERERSIPPRYPEGTDELRRSREVATTTGTGEPTGTGRLEARHCPGQTDADPEFATWARWHRSPRAAEAGSHGRSSTPGTEGS